MNTLTPELLQQITQAVLTAWLEQIKKSTILLWKHRRMANAFTLKINQYEWTGFIRKDKKGESYWKFQEWEEPTLLEERNPTFKDGANQTAVEKFHQRQEKVNDGKPSNPTQPH